MNKNYFWKYKKPKPTKEEVKNTLELMNYNNPKLQKLISTFDCEVIKTKTNKINLKQKQMNLSNKKVPTKVVEQTETETKTKEAVIYPKGILIFKPHEKAPDFVKGQVIINLEGFEAWLKDNEQYISKHDTYGPQIKFKLLNGKDGLYLSVDTYKKPE